MDRKTLKYCLWSAGTALTAAGFLAFLVAPGRTPKEKRAPFIGRNYAHRGLHRIDRSIPENSLPAFEAAARIGYGVELDVHITRDGELIVFHDDNTKRLCGVDSRVEDMTWSELCKLRLAGTEYGIPLLSEALEVLGTHCPVIIELKRGPRDREMCRKTYALMKRYGGRYCIESFDPGIVFWFRRHAPEILRGKLAYDPAEMVKDTSRLNAFLVGNLLTNFITRPHFISYGLGRKPLLVRFCERMGAMKVAWVSRDWASEKKNDAVIFEYYRPRVKY